MSLFVVYKSALHGQQFPCQTGKGYRMKHLQIYQGLPVWRMGEKMYSEVIILNLSGLACVEDGFAVELMQYKTLAT